MYKFVIFEQYGNSEAQRERIMETNIDSAMVARVAQKLANEMNRMIVIYRDGSYHAAKNPIKGDWGI